MWSEFGRSVLGVSYECSKRIIEEYCRSLKVVVGLSKKCSMSAVGVQ